MERFEEVKNIGAGNFGVAKLMRDKKTNELVAMKFLPRGPKVLLTPTHIAIVMEYAAGGELFERICSAGRFSEDEARYFFQQLISGVSYCHSMKICHRDLKLENTLLDGGPARRLKICDFGYSKSSVLHSRPKSTVGTPAYIAPEVLARKEYDGKLADVWSCGVTLYVMLVGAYPFEDPKDPKNFKKTIQRIVTVQYKIPDSLRISNECKHLLARIFVANPQNRITIAEIRRHPWFLMNLPRELKEGAEVQYLQDDAGSSPQPIEDITKILEEAKIPPASPTFEDDEMNEAGDDDDEDDPYGEEVKEALESHKRDVEQQGGHGYYDDEGGDEIFVYKKDKYNQGMDARREYNQRV